MFRATIVLLTITCFTACSHQKEGTEKQVHEVSPVKEEKGEVASAKKMKPLALDFFAAVPDTIDGCGDYYTYDSIHVAPDKYIFLSNMTTFAIIRIKGKDIYLEKQKTVEVTDAHFISIFKGQGYSAVLEVKRTKKYDEGGFYKGTLKVVYGDEGSIFWVQGETGC